MVTDRLVNNITETFSAMRFGVDISKLHVLCCVHHVKYIADIYIMESGD